jgi:hypothetical protein
VLSVRASKEDGAPVRMTDLRKAWREMEFSDTRRDLLRKLDHIASPQDYVVFQRALAYEIMAAEENKSLESKQHMHMLRLMGDAIAWKLLDNHTIREFARERHPVPIHLTNQGDSFEFVLDVARQMAELNSFPIVTDLTHLIAVGDIVDVSSNGVHVAECKSRKPPAYPPSGRAARQEKRNTRASFYLNQGHTVNESGSNRITVELPEPPSEFDKLKSCVAEAATNGRGSAVVEFGTRNFLMAIYHEGRGPEEYMPALMPLMDPRGWDIPTLEGFSAAIAEPSPFRSNPYALPLGFDARMALAEGDLILMRLVDLGLLRADGDPSLEVAASRRGVEIATRVDGVSHAVSDRFLENIVWQFKAMCGVRKLLVDIASSFSVVAEQSEAGANEHSRPTGPSVFSSFVYRNFADGDPSPVVVSNLEQFESLWSNWSKDDPDQTNGSAP